MTMMRWDLLGLGGGLEGVVSPGERIAPGFPPITTRRGARRACGTAAPRSGVSGGTAVGGVFHDGPISSGSGHISDDSPGRSESREIPRFRPQEWSTEHKECAVKSKKCRLILEE